MKIKHITALFLIVSLLSLVLLQLNLYLTVEAQESSVDWDNRYSQTVSYGNGTFTTSVFMGPQVFWDNVTDSWQELKFEYDATKKYYLLQNSHMSLRVYEDKPSSYFDPDNQRLCVEKEIVSVEYDDKGKWKIVDLKNPVFTVNTNSTSEARLTKTFSGSNGVLSVTYTLKAGSRLKHDFVFKSFFADERTFRVHFKLEGVPSLKVKSPVGEETLTGTTSIGKVPYLMFGEDNNNLVLSEYLWSLGVTNETTGEWTPTTLQDVVLDVEAGKGKADILIGNYTLSENESLLIDPDSDTWQVGQSSDDCTKGYDGSWWFNLAYWLGTTVGYYTSGTGYKLGSGIRFTTVTVPNEATINSAYLKINCDASRSNTVVNSRIKGEASDDAITFSDIADFDGRERTTAIVDWDAIGSWSGDQWYDSPDIKSVIQEIVNREGWVSENALVIFWQDFEGRSTESDFTDREGHHYGEGSSIAPKLEVTWEAEGDTTPPTHSNIDHNTTIANDPALFSCCWNDETELSHYIFSTNNTGTWSNETATAFGATPSWANVLKTLNATVGQVVGYQWYANDTSNNWSSTGIQTLTTTDGDSPTFSSITANTTQAGDSVQLSVTINDNVAVSHFIYSWNNTGTWTNQTTTAFSSNPCQLEGTWNSTVGNVISVKAYANDTSNNWAVSSQYDFTLTDSISPTVANIGTNTTLAGQPVLFYAEWSDLELSGYIFGTNQTGSWVNATWIDEWAGTPSSGWSNVSETLNSTVGLVVGYRFYANDTSDNWGDSGIQTLTTNTAPTIGSFSVSDYEIEPNEIFYINCIVTDATGYSSIVNATLEISDGIILLWDRATDTFTEYQDTHGYCVLKICDSTQLNSTSYSLRFWLSLASNMSTETKGLISDNTLVYDGSGSSGTNNASDLFHFTGVSPEAPGGPTIPSDEEEEEPEGLILGKYDISKTFVYTPFFSETYSLKIRISNPTTENQSCVLEYWIQLSDNATKKWQKTKMLVVSASSTLNVTLKYPIRQGGIYTLGYQLILPDKSEMFEYTINVESNLKKMIAVIVAIVALIILLVLFSREKEKKEKKRTKMRHE